MNANYTPGPWVAEAHPAGHYGIFQRDHPHQVAEVLQRNMSPAEVAANAELIAAAPEMRSALNLICKFIDAADKAAPDWPMWLRLRNIDYANFYEARLQLERVRVRLAGSECDAAADADNE